MTNMKQQLMNDIFNTSTDGLQRETWRKVKLGDIAELKNGYSFKSSDYIENGKYKIITIKNVTGEKYVDTHNCNCIYDIPDNIREHQKLKVGDILVSMTGNVGRVSVVNEDGLLLNQRVGLISIKDKDVDTGYLAHVLRTGAFESAMIELGHGAAQPNIGKDDIESYEFMLPPLSIQHKISSILSAYDSLISSTDDKSSNLRLAKQQLMNNIFSERESNKNLVFTDTWRKVKLGDLFDVRNGYTPSKSNDAFWANGDIPWFRMEDIRLNGNILTDAVQHITSLGVKSSGLFPADSIIEATTATIGEHALIKVPFICNQQFTCFTVKDSYKDSTDINYLHYIFYQVDEFCKNHLNDGALPAVDKTALLEYEVYLPSLPEQKQIASILTDYDCLIESERESESILRKAKTQLMSEIFNRV